MQVHLVDGTYELFRHHFALPSHLTAEGQEVGALRGVASSVMTLLESGATHVGVATDHVVESFRNDLYDGYKSGEGIPADLAGQFGPLEQVLEAMGLVVWPMVEFEADDGLAAAAAVASADPEVSRVLVCTPDKDLAQCVEGTRVVQVDRRRDVVIDHDGVVAKYGVPPASIADWLALVGDTADGFPGIPRWGAKSAAVVLARYGHIANIPPDHNDWDVTVRGAATLAANLASHADDARLFLQLATLRTDVCGIGTVDQWRWQGPAADVEVVLAEFDLQRLVPRLGRLAEAGHQ